MTKTVPRSLSSPSKTRKAGPRSFCSLRESMTGHHGHFETRPGEVLKRHRGMIRLPRLLRYSSNNFEKSSLLPTLKHIWRKHCNLGQVNTGSTWPWPRLNIRVVSTLDGPAPSQVAPMVVHANPGNVGKLLSQFKELGFLASYDTTSCTTFPFPLCATLRALSGYMLLGNEC